MAVAGSVFGTLRQALMPADSARRRPKWLSQPASRPAGRPLERIHSCHSGRGGPNVRFVIKHYGHRLASPAAGSAASPSWCRTSGQPCLGCCCLHCTWTTRSSPRTSLAWRAVRAEAAGGDALRDYPTSLLPSLARRRRSPQQTPAQRPSGFALAGGGGGVRVGIGIGEARPHLSF